MNSWTEEGWRLAATLLAAAGAGFLLGNFYLAFIVALMLYAGWMIYRLHVLNRWLMTGAATKDTPDTVGLLDSVIQLVHREQRRSGRQKDKMRRTLSQFNALASEIPDATVVLDDKWLIQWCNAAAERLLGINRKVDRGHRIDNLLRTPEFVAFLQEVHDEHRELEIESPVLQDVTLLVTCVPAGSNQLILTARNITQRVQLREMRKAFVADVSHELKTPLTVIQGHLELLDADNPQSVSKDAVDTRPFSQPVDDQQLAIERIKEQSDRMAKIVSDLLTLSKLESNALEPDEGTWLNMGQLIDGILGDLTGNLKQHNIETRLDSSLQLLGVESEIYSCCQNLIQNALAYNPAGTRIEVEWRYAANDEPRRDWITEAVGTKLEPGNALFVVRDNGIGIPEEHLSKLSQRFYRVDRDRSRATGGTGLGLAIVKYIAQRHSGHLYLQSESGKGSLFAVSFPVFRQRQFADQSRKSQFTG